MQIQISSLVYLLPNPDKKIGSLSFCVTSPILFNENQKNVPNNESADVTISKETENLLEEAIKSLIKDIEK